MKENAKWLVIGLVVGLVVGLIRGCAEGRSSDNGRTVDSVTVTVVEKHDTIIREPKPAKDPGVVIRYVPVPSKEASEGTSEGTSEVSSQNTTAAEKVDSIPIMQKMYEDSLYTAWVSGYEAQLDSIRVTEKVINTTTTITKVKEGSRWAIGPTLAVGLTSDGQIRPVLGVGVTYKIRWKKTR